MNNELVGGGPPNLFCQVLRENSARQGEAEKNKFKKIFLLVFFPFTLGKFTRLGAGELCFL